MLVSGMGNPRQAAASKIVKDAPDELTRTVSTTSRGNPAVTAGRNVHPRPLRHQTRTPPSPYAGSHRNVSGS